MIDNINKLLFLDIETVGLYYDLDDLHHQSPQLYKVWEDSGYEYFKRQYPGLETAILPEQGPAASKAEVYR